MSKTIWRHGREYRLQPLRRLGIDPILLAAVGPDLGAYAGWMDESGVARDNLLVLDDEYTASCFITTDASNNQIITFHPGAMDRAHEATIASVGRDLKAGIVSPNGKQAMIDYARDLKAQGTACVMDPGQGLPILDADELVVALTGAAVYIVNEYEWELTREKTGLDEDGIAEKVGALIMTQGEKGSILRRGASPGRSACNRIASRSHPSKRRRWSIRRAAGTPTVRDCSTRSRTNSISRWARDSAI